MGDSSQSAALERLCTAVLPLPRASSLHPRTLVQPTPHRSLQPLPSRRTAHPIPGPGIMLPGLSSHPLHEGWLHLGWEHSHPQQTPAIPAPQQLPWEHIGAEARAPATSCAKVGHYGHSAPSSLADPLHSRTFWIFLIWSESVSNRRVFRKSVTLATRPSM